MDVRILSFSMAILVIKYCQQTNADPSLKVLVRRCSKPEKVCGTNEVTYKDICTLRENLGVRMAYTGKCRGKSYKRTKKRSIDQKGSIEYRPDLILEAPSVSKTEESLQKRLVKHFNPTTGKWEFTVEIIPSIVITPTFHRSEIVSNKSNDKDKKFTESKPSESNVKINAPFQGNMFTIANGEKSMNTLIDKIKEMLTNYKFPTKLHTDNIGRKTNSVSPIINKAQENVNKNDLIGVVKPKTSPKKFNASLNLFKPTDLKNEINNILDRNAKLPNDQIRLSKIMNPKVENKTFDEKFKKNKSSSKENINKPLYSNGTDTNQINLVKTTDNHLNFNMKSKQTTKHGSRKLPFLKKPKINSTQSLNTISKSNLNNMQKKLEKPKLFLEKSSNYSNTSNITHNKRLPIKIVISNLPIDAVKDDYPAFYTNLSEINQSMQNKTSSSKIRKENNYSNHLRKKSSKLLENIHPNKQKSIEKKKPVKNNWGEYTVGTLPPMTVDFSKKEIEPHLENPSEKEKPIVKKKKKIRLKNHRKNKLSKINDPSLLTTIRPPVKVFEKTESSKIHTVISNLPIDAVKEYPALNRNLSKINQSMQNKTSLPKIRKGQFFSKQLSKKSSKSLENIHPNKQKSIEKKQPVKDNWGKNLAVRPRSMPVYFPTIETVPIISIKSRIRRKKGRKNRLSKLNDPSFLLKIKTPVKTFKKTKLSNLNNFSAGPSNKNLSADHSKETYPLHKTSSTELIKNNLTLPIKKVKNLSNDLNKKFNPVLNKTKEVSEVLKSTNPVKLSKTKQIHLVKRFTIESTSNVFPVLNKTTPAKSTENGSREDSAYPIQLNETKPIKLVKSLSVQPAYNVIPVQNKTTSFESNKNVEFSKVINRTISTKLNENLQEHPTELKFHSLPSGINKHTAGKVRLHGLSHKRRIFNNGIKMRMKQLLKNINLPIKQDLHPLTVENKNSILMPKTVKNNENAINIKPIEQPFVQNPKINDTLIVENLKEIPMVTNSSNQIENLTSTKSIITKSDNPENTTYKMVDEGKPPSLNSKLATRLHPLNRGFIGKARNPFRYLSLKKKLKKKSKKKVDKKVTKKPIVTTESPPPPPPPIPSKWGTYYLKFPGNISDYIDFEFKWRLININEVVPNSTIHVVEDLMTKNYSWISQSEKKGEKNYNKFIKNELKQVNLKTKPKTNEDESNAQYDEYTATEEDTTTSTELPINFEKTVEIETYQLKDNEEPVKSSKKSKKKNKKKKKKKLLKSLRKSRKKSSLKTLSNSSSKSEDFGNLVERNGSYVLELPGNLADKIQLEFHWRLKDNIPKTISLPIDVIQKKVKFNYNWTKDDIKDLVEEEQISEDDEMKNNNNEKDDKPKLPKERVNDNLINEFMDDQKLSMNTNMTSLFGANYDSKQLLQNSNEGNDTLFKPGIYFLGAPEKMSSLDLSKIFGNTKMSNSKLKRMLSLKKKKS